VSLLAANMSSVKERKKEHARAHEKESERQRELVGADVCVCGGVGSWVGRCLGGTVQD